ncbi:MAG: GNAT family protein [Chloroflexota bacterium]
MKPPAPVTLTGRFVRLEPLGEEHRGDLEAAAAEDPDALRYGALQLTLMGWESWFGEASAGVAEDRYVAWATIALDTGRAVGSTRFGDIDVPSERLEIGWTWLAPSRWRSALNSEAKLLQLTYAFEELGAGRVALKTDGRNERSQAAIERLGGVREGTLRRHLRMPDGFIRDTVYYSILAEEWPPIRERLRDRLYDATA